MQTGLETLAAQASHQRCAGVSAVCDTQEDSRAKLLIVRSALAMRTRWPDVFQHGNYLPLAVKGELAAHLYAYARNFGDRTVITAAPRFFVRLLGDAEMLPLGENVWRHTSVELPSGLGDKHYTCTFTGKVLKPQKRQSRRHILIAQILAELPEGLIFGEK